MKFFIICVLLPVFLACGPKKTEEAQSLPGGVSFSGDDKSIELADRMALAMGGMDAWNAKRYLQFDFVVESGGKEIARHSHLWDKFTGRYRVQGKMRDGRSYCMLYDDIHKRSGQAFIDGRLTESKEREEKLQYGYNRFINDTYWLLMPWKLKDPGVHLRYEGLQKDSASGEKYEVVHLSFDRVGLTPKDQYWAFINPETFTMDKWRFFLQDSEDGSYYWKNWQSYGALKFSNEKTSVAGNRAIRTEKIKLPDQVPDNVFIDPQTALP